MHNWKSIAISPRWLMLAFLWFHLPSATAETPRNFFSNPGFELGRDGWNLGKGGKTEARFTVDEKDRAEGQSSALLTVDSIDDWGVQFGQTFAAGLKGKTYTFAAFAKCTGEPVEIGLEIERNANPYDRAVGRKFTLTKDWKELHVTFTVEKDFSQGWFAYISCTQPKAQFRLDMVRLYEGAYVPYEQIAKEEAETSGVRVFDTGAPSASSLAGDALAGRSGWTQLAEDDVSHAFKGDAVIANARVAMVLRRESAGVEVYSLDPGKPAMRAILAPADGKDPAKLASFTIAENSLGNVAVEVTFSPPQGDKSALRCELKAGQPIVQTEARDGLTALRVEAPSRFLVVPDFFADDVVIAADDLPVATADLPSDNVVLHLLPGGDAIVMTVVKTSEEDVRVVLAREGDQRMIRSSELRYGKDGKIWVAILAAPAIWHAQEIAREQAGKIVRTSWKAPFPAQWRTDWQRDDHLTDSWEMLNERSDGKFEKRGLFGGPETVPADRKRWTTVLGMFEYPCWVDKNGQGNLQPLKRSAASFRGPAVIYPLSRGSATALDVFTVVDIVRETLGVGPCEYVLDVEGQQSQYKGMATCGVRDTLNPIYANHEQKQRRKEIEKTLDALMVFVRHIRGRIEGYVAFGHEMLDYLAKQKTAHPELADRIGELEKLAGMIDAKLALRKVQIKTPDDVAKTVEEFRRTVLDDESDDAANKCKRFTAAWVDVGGNQDELVGECRWVVKMLRQKAGLLMATDPHMAEIAKEIRRRSQIVLRNPAVHEGARH